MPRPFSLESSSSFAGSSPAERSTDVSDLERRILSYPLPWRVLAGPRNLAFLTRCFGQAVRLFVRLPLDRVDALFPPRGAPFGAEADLEKAAIAHAFTERILRSPFFPVRRTCLRRSLLLAHLLRESGIETAVCFGVRERGGSLEGHAWLAREGSPFLEREETWKDYALIFTLPREDEGARR